MVGGKSIHNYPSISNKTFVFCVFCIRKIKNRAKSLWCHILKITKWTPQQLSPVRKIQKAIPQLLGCFRKNTKGTSQRLGRIPKTGNRAPQPLSRTSKTGNRAPQPLGRISKTGNRTPPPLGRTSRSGKGKALFWAINEENKNMSFNNPFWGWIRGGVQIPSTTSLIK